MIRRGWIAGALVLGACAADMDRAADRVVAAADSGADTSTRAGDAAPADSSCRASSLASRLVRVDAGAGHRAARVTLENRGTAPCTLSGRPAVALLDSAGRAVAVTVDSMPATYLKPGFQVGPVRVAPGDTAVFDVHFGVVEGEPGGCPEGAAFRVSPPADRASVGEVKVDVRACGARIRVTPVLDPASVDL